jgi:two-component system cell cycle response regulator CtrA
MRILLIEDDINMSNVLMAFLRTEGFTCDNTDSGEDGIQMLKLYTYDCVLLDLMLQGGINGMETLRRIRSAKQRVSVIIISGLNGISEKVKGLSIGADDYIEKPYHSKELVARIHAVVRRSLGYEDSKIEFGRLSINLQTKTAEADGIPLKLTGKEYAMLELMMLKKGYTLTKEDFLSYLYDERYGDHPALKIIDVFACKLRAKIQQALNSDAVFIETCWGRGYMLVNPDKDQQQNQNIKKKKLALG